MADLGEGTLCPLLFLDQTEAQRAKKNFLGGTGPPLSKVLDDPPPPPPSQGLDLPLPLVYIQRVVLVIKDGNKYYNLIRVWSRRYGDFQHVQLRVDYRLRLFTNISFGNSDFIMFLGHSSK